MNAVCRFFAAWKEKAKNNMLWGFLTILVATPLVAPILGAVIATSAMLGSNTARIVVTFWVELGLIGPRR